MTQKKEPITLERIRKYIGKCRDDDKVDHKIEAMEFMLKLIDGEEAKHKASPIEEMTIEYIERWMGRWSDARIKSVPFAVKALDYTLGVLAYERDQHQAFMDRMGACITNIVDSSKIIKEHHTQYKKTSNFHYRLSPNKREASFLKSEKD